LSENLAENQKNEGKAAHKSHKN